MIFLIPSKLWENVKSTHMHLKCQFYDDLNRFHAFWADFIFFFREMLANNHVMENERIDLFNFLLFSSNCAFRWKIYLVPKLLRCLCPAVHCAPSCREVSSKHRGRASSSCSKHSKNLFDLFDKILYNHFKSI